MAIGTWSWDDQLAQGEPSGYLTELERFLGTCWCRPTVCVWPSSSSSPRPARPTPSATRWPADRPGSKQTELTDAWDAAARQAVAAFPGRAVYLTTQQLFAPGGYFLTWMRTPQGTWVRARKLDNTHMCPYGAAQFGALVTEELTPILHLAQAKPGWEFGSWTRGPALQRPARCLPRRPATGRLPRHCRVPDVPSRSAAGIPP